MVWYNTSFGSRAMKLSLAVMEAKGKPRVKLDKTLTKYLPQ